MNTKLITRSLRSAVLLATLLAPAFTARAQDARSAARPPAPSAEAVPAASGVINLNTASLEELTRLPGVGPARAQAIIELRTKSGGFKSTEDLMRVRGIGRKTYRKLEPMLRLSGATTLVEAHATRRAPAGR
jgi:competence protein ComEA